MNLSSALTLAAATDHLLLARAPILLLDTCALLDIIRAPLRGNPQLIEAALRLVDHAVASPTRLHVVITSTIATEWTSHASRVRAELDDALRRIRQTTEALRAACRFAGLPLPRQVSSAYDRVPSSLLAIASNLHETAVLLANDDQCQLRAMTRLVAELPPSKRGEQIKDCSIIEHFLALCSDLRNAGFRQRCFFVTSNTNDYCSAKAQLHPNLDAEFRAVGLQFVTDIAWARYELGL